jgi:hypothetical protein
MRKTAPSLPETGKFGFLAQALENARLERHIAGSELRPAFMVILVWVWFLNCLPEDTA